MLIIFGYLRPALCNHSYFIRMFFFFEIMIYIAYTGVPTHTRPSARTRSHKQTHTHAHIYNTHVRADPSLPLPSIKVQVSWTVDSGQTETR